MEFDFNCEEALSSNNNGIHIITPESLQTIHNSKEVGFIIDTLGILSARVFLIRLKI